jgi:hypothetical protein
MYCSWTDYKALFTNGVLFMEGYSWSTVHESLFTECWVAGHAISVRWLQQCGDRWSDLLAWLAQVVVVLFLKLVCSGSLICGFGGLAVLQVWRSGNLRVRGWQCCGATGLGSGFPKIGEWQR